MRLPAAQDIPTGDIQAVLLRIAALQVQLAALQNALVARIVIDGMPDDGRRTGGEQLLTVIEASARLAKSPDWLYRHARRLPFTRRIGRSLRFSTRGLDQYIRQRSGA